MVNGVSLLQIMLFVDLVPPLLPTIVATKTSQDSSTVDLR